MPKTPTEKFAAALKELRLQKFLTQREVATAAGVSEPAYRVWESGRGKPSLLSFRKLAKAFAMSPDDLDNWTSFRV